VSTFSIPCGIPSRISYKEPRRPASWEVHSVQIRNRRVELALKQRRSRLPGVTIPSAVLRRRQKAINEQTVNTSMSCRPHHKFGHAEAKCFRLQKISLTKAMAIKGVGLPAVCLQIIEISRQFQTKLECAIYRARERTLQDPYSERGVRAFNGGLQRSPQPS